MVVPGFDGERIGAIALDFILQRADHLRMAGIAAFADVDVAASKLEGRVDPHVGIALDRIVDGEQRRDLRSEEHTSELQSLMRISYAVFCLKKKQNTKS